MIVDDEKQRTILRQRAALLATTRKKVGADGLNFALFARQGMHYAIDARYVREVARVIAPTALPLTADHWIGISSLHGELLGIVDLPRLLADATDGGRVATEIDEDTQTLVLVLGKAHGELGLLIDEVLDSRALGDDVVPVGAHESGSSRGLIGGATADGVRLIVAEALMNDPRLFLEREHKNQPQPP